MIFARFMGEVLGLRPTLVCGHGGASALRRVAKLAALFFLSGQSIMSAIAPRPGLLSL